MAVLSPTAHVAAPSSALRALARPGRLEHAAVGALLVDWAWLLSRGTGGRDPHTLTVGLGLLILALAASRPWRRVPATTLWLAASLPVAAVAVCLVAPTGWRGANEAASYAFAAGTFVVVRAYARTAERRRALLALVALAGAIEFAEAWLPWWGAGDPSRPMWGTFYWHNQYGAFLLPGALIGLALVAWPSPRDRVIGWVAVPLCSAGVLFSTSRTVIALLLAGWAAVGALLLAQPGRRRTLPRFLAATALAAATAFALTGPPFFAHRAAPTSAVQARGQSQSASGDGAWRLEVWKEAAVVTAAHPLTGTGFHGFGEAGVTAAPGWPHSAFTHNAWLQALVDGGVLLGGPFTFVTVLLVLLLWRRPFQGLRERGPESLGAVAVLALGLLAVHSFVDFDLTYPALFGLLALLAGWTTAEVAAREAALAGPDVSGAAEGAPAAERGVRRRSAVLAVVVLAVLAGVGMQTAWHGGLQLNLASRALGNGTVR